LPPAQSPPPFLHEFEDDFLVQVLTVLWAVGKTENETVDDTPVAAEEKRHPFLRLVAKKTHQFDDPALRFRDWTLRR
jgi:hypothetical protein